MKKLIMLPVLLIIGLTTACVNDEDCQQADVVGTYTGTKECDEMNPEPVTFQVTAGNSDIQLLIDGVTATVDDCDLFGSSVIQGSGREIDGDIDGVQVSFLETIKISGGEDVRCVWKGTKQ